MTRQSFCDLCDVSMDLHSWPDDADDPGCESAAAKADLIGMVMRAVIGGATDASGETT